MTLSYADDGTPRLAESFETNNAYAVSDLQQGILKFVNKAIALGLHEDCCLDDDYALCLQELEHPNRALAEAMGDYLYLLGMHASGTQRECTVVLPAEAEETTTSLARGIR